MNTGLDTELSYEGNEILVEADRIKLIQVISNLLDNVIRFTKGRTILVKHENTIEAYT